MDTTTLDTIITTTLDTHLKTVVQLSIVNDIAVHRLGANFDHAVPQESIDALTYYLVDQERKVKALVAHIRKGADKEGYDLDFLARLLETDNTMTGE